MRVTTDRAMMLARTLRGGARGCKTLVQRPLEAVGGSSTPTGVVLDSAVFVEPRQTPHSPPELVAMAVYKAAGVSVLHASANVSYRQLAVAARGY